jgi:hypothetical protein
MKIPENLSARQNGNALWFILIAVVLMGALTILLSRSGGDTNQTGDTEQLRVKTSQLVRYAQGIQNAIEQMRIRGVSESDISFENAVTTANYTNAACIVSDCKVFDSGGGGQEYRDPPGDVNDGSEWIFTGENNVGTTAGPVGTTAAGTGNDIVMLLPNVKNDLCVQMNRDLSVGTAGAIPSDASGVGVTPFTGAYQSASLKIIDGNPAPFELDRKSGGCFTDTVPDPDVNYIYFVLLAR